MKKAFLLGLMALLVIPGVLACGEKGIEFVGSLEEGDYKMEKSACTKSYFPSNGENFLVEESDIQITAHQAKHILADYLDMEYGSDAMITDDDVEVPGHESHGHGHGNPQLSHGHKTWTFNVEIQGYMEGKAHPRYVDMETGEVYGMGCGLGAGAVVFSPDISEYPDSDQSDVDFHAGMATTTANIIQIQEGFDPLQFLLSLFGLW